VLRYLKGTPEKGIWMKNNNSNEICGYFDADWARIFDRKSTADFCMFVGKKLSYMKKARSKMSWLDQGRSGISSHDINNKRVDMDQATIYGSRDKNTIINENVL
jgi:hypothetical protein